jgi:Protein of unknown function (DUF3224)
MSKLAVGPFDVQSTPHPPYDSSDGVILGRMTIAKQFHGDLDGNSIVEMIAARTPTPGSAGYVAIERVVATLHGKAGSFVLQHSGTMSRGQQSLAVTVVPDSGTGELVGLAGTMKIEIAEGKHSYVFDYTLG